MATTTAKALPDEALTEQALQRLLTAYEGRQQMFDPQMLAMAAGFLAPTQTGGFGESLSNAAKGVLQAGEAEQKQEQERAKGMLEIAQLKGQIAERKRIQQQYQDYFEGLKANKPVTAGKQGLPEGIQLFPEGPVVTEEEFLAEQAQQNVPLATAKKEWSDYLRKSKEVKESGVYDSRLGIWVPTSTEIINVPFLSDGKTYPLSKAEAAQHQNLKSRFANAKGDSKAQAFNDLEDFENRYNAPVPEAIRSQAKALRARPSAATEAAPPLVVPLPTDQQVSAASVTSALPMAPPVPTTPEDQGRVTTGQTDSGRFGRGQATVPSQGVGVPNITSRPSNFGPPPALAAAPVPAAAPPRSLPAAPVAAPPAAPVGQFSPAPKPAQAFQGIQSVEAQEARKQAAELEAARAKAAIDVEAAEKKERAKKQIETANIPLESAAKRGETEAEAVAKSKAEREAAARNAIYAAEQTSGDTIATASQFKKYASDPNAKLMFGILKDNSISSGIATLIKEALRVGDFSIGVPAIEEVMRNSNLSPQDQAKYRGFVQLTANMQLAREQAMKGATSGKEREILASASISADDNPLAIEMKSNILIAKANFDRWVAKSLDESKKSAIEFKRSKEYADKFDRYLNTLNNLISGKTKLVSPSEAGSSSAARDYANRLAGIR